VDWRTGGLVNGEGEERGEGRIERVGLGVRSTSRSAQVSIAQRRSVGPQRSLGSHAGAGRCIARCLSVYLSVSVCLHLDMSIYQHFEYLIHPSVCLFIHLICISTYPSTYPTPNTSVCPPTPSNISPHHYKLNPSHLRNYTRRRWCVSRQRKEHPASA
jgi:hypothetical protein